MADDGGNPTAAQGTQPAQSAQGQRQFFADQLRMLFAAAGRPALKKVVSEATAVARSVGSDRTISVQRVSDWRSGNRLPATFEAVHPVLVVLIRAARELNSEPPVPGLYSLKQWENWWKAARGQTGSPRAEKTAGPTVPPGIRPYKGLASYGEQDARLFFGRTQSVRSLTDVVIASHGQGPVVVTGASGVGKSSLVRAGLIPQLCSGTECHPVVITPGTDPVKRLVDALPELAEVSDPTDYEAVHAALRAVCERTSTTLLVIVVDQIEELFTHCTDSAERTRFLALLETASTGHEEDAPALVVATMRSDFYDQAVAYPVLARALERRTKTVQPLDRDDLVEVITAPAKLVGARLEAGLVDLILHDLAGMTRGEISGTELPLLSHLLDSLWDKRSGGALTVAAYRATGGVRGSVAASAERAWESLGDDADRARARAMLVHLVYVTATGTDVKIARPLNELLAVAGDDRDAAARVLDHFVSARVLVVDAGTVELIHDAVIDAWPRLKSWIQQDRAHAAMRQQIEADAQTWLESGRNRGLLYQRGRMDVVAEQNPQLAETSASSRGLVALSPAAVAFLDASRRQIARQTRLRHAVIAVLAGSTIVALVMSGLAWDAKSRAETERSTAQFQQIVALSDSLKDDDPTTSAHLALAAAGLQPDNPIAYSRLIATQAVPLAYTLTGHTGPIYGVVVSPDGSTLASASDDGSVRLWSLEGDHPTPIGEPLQLSSKYMASVSFTPDGRYLAVGAADSGVWIFDVSDRAAPKAVLERQAYAEGAVHNVRFSPTGRVLAVPYDDGRVALVDTSDPASGRFPTTLITGHEGGVRTAAFRPGGDVLATSSDDRTVRLWNVHDPSHPVPLGEPLTGFGDVAHSVAFNGDGSILAASSDDGVLHLFDTSDPRRAHRVGIPKNAHTGGVWNIAFLPDGATLASASWDGTVKLWNLTPGEWTLDELGPPLTGHGGGVPTLTVGPQGGMLVTGGQDANIRIWTMPHTRIAVADTALTRPAISRAGDLVATGSYGPDISLWRVGADGDWTRAGGIELPRPLGGAYVCALSPSGTVLATAPTSGGSVQLWDVRDPSSPKPLGEPVALGTRFTSALGFGPDGTTLVTGSDDFSVQLWDIADPAHPVPWGDPLEGPRNLVRVATISPDGRSLVVTSADSDIYAWDITDPRQPKRVDVADGHTGGVNGAAFGKDGDVLVTGGDDHVVRVWDRDDAGNFTLRPTALEGHSGTVYSVSIDRTATRAVSGSDDGTIRLWDVSDPDDMREMGGPVTDIGVGRWQVVLAPDGTIVGAGGDGVLRTWGLDADAVVSRICRSTSARLEDVLDRFELPPPAREVC
ncbi:WD40 repeat domain-containing protein [Rhodococcus sp. Z13]|uniref:WD40 repeat domain-containing protein n=1 Tax=Rhodococcus sacchari TaxID=2962047 RepID=A0ACD4DIL6_9NOCA|nr:WD40 repeat domain-containing protein [Rhodococcus sp. Z13]UYP19852.1 WD40 repeat domain-containing protein [Rhodococcus sp. Z13]